MRMLRCGLVLALLLPIASGCGESEQSPAPTTATDALGRTVELTRPIDRVVSLAPNLTEIAFAAGGGSRLVAVTTADDYPPAVDTLNRVSALPVDFEAVAATRPDLVLATDQVNPPGDTETFAALDVPIYFFSFGSLTDVFDAIRRMGTLLGTEAAATDTARALERQVARLEARTDSLATSERPRVLVLVGDDTLYSFGEESYIHRLVELAGGRSVTDTLDASAPTLSEEFVLTARPDVIIGAWGTDYDPSRLLELHPTWDVVPAVQNDRVYGLPPSLLLRPGPRLVEGARRVAARLHPDRFGGAASPSLSPDSSGLRSSRLSSSPPSPTP